MTMPPLPERIRTLTPDGDGWDLFYEARRIVAKGVPVIELTIGEHDVRTDPSILDAMDRSARAGNTGYAAVPGIPALRAAVADRVESRTGVPTRPENVLVTPGGQSALFAAHMVACAPGDRAGYVSPHYATYTGTIRAAGAEPVEVRAEADDGFEPRADAIPEVRSLLLNTPGNPTGAVYSCATLTNIAERLSELDAWAISDEVYDTMIWESAHGSIRALPGMAERSLVVGSMSKSHAMTGSRIGWLVGPAEAIAYATDLATHTTYGVPGFIQDAALFALAQGPEFEALVAEPFRRRREIAMRVLSNRPGLRIVEPKGGMYAMVDIRPTGLTGHEFAAKLLREHHVATMPGESFGPAAAGHLRVALTVDDARLEAALETMAALAAALRSSASDAP